MQKCNKIHWQATNTITITKKKRNVKETNHNAKEEYSEKPNRDYSKLEHARKRHRRVYNRSSAHGWLPYVKCGSKNTSVTI